MKVVILAGGFGTRLSEYTDNIPKPMVRIGQKPILWHIMSHYAKYGIKDFNLALVTRQKLLKNIFKLQCLNSDFTVNLETGSVNTISIIIPTGMYH